MLSVLADEKEITHDEGHQVRAHLHSDVKLVLKQAVRKRQRPQLGEDKIKPYRYRTGFRPVFHYITYLITTIQSFMHYKANISY